MAEYNVGYKPKAHTKVQFQKFFGVGGGGPADGAHLVGGLSSLCIPAAGFTATRRVFSNKSAVPAAGAGKRMIAKYKCANKKILTLTIEHFDPSKDAVGSASSLIGKTYYADGALTTDLVDLRIENVTYV